MLRDLTAQPQQVLFDERGLAGRDRKRGRVANAGDDRRVMAQTFEFGKDCAERERARRRLDSANCLDGLTKGQAVCERRYAGKPFGQQQGAIGFLPLGDLFDTSIFVKESRNRADDVLAHCLEQEMGGLGKIREYGADRHREGAGRGHNRRRLPSRVRRAKAHPLRRIETSAHRVDAFGPILVQDEFAEPGWPSKVNPNRSSASRSCQSKEGP